MRSGTSVLQAVLCSTEETNPHIHEAQFLTQLVRLYIYARSSFNRYLCHYVENLEELKTFHVDLIERFLDRTLQRYHPASHLALKNPEMTPLFPEIGELVDNAKFVVVVRDPRDTIASMRSVAKRQSAQGQVTNLTRMAESADKLAARYNWYYAPVIEISDPAFIGRRIIVRLEDLVQDTDSVIDELAEFTALPLGAFDRLATWRTLVDFNDKRLMQEPYHSELRGRPLTAVRIGQFAQSLTAEDIAAIEKVCAPIMHAFGYAPTRPA